MKRNYSLDEFGVKKHETVLKNGLKVIFIEKPFAPIYAKIMIAAGSVFNPSDNGLAHLTEHIIMSGSKDTSKEEFHGLMESVGGFKNAYTSRTWMSVNTEIAEVRHLAQMRKFFSIALESIFLTEESLKKEKEIIFSELQKAKSNIYYDSGLKLKKLFTKNTPWGYSELGDIKGINAITLEEVEKFFSSYCVVENMTLVIAGGCTIKDVKKTFQDINFLHGEKSVLPQSPNQINSNQRFFFKKDIPQTSVMLVFNGPVDVSRDSYIINFIMSFVHHGAHSRFYNKIRNEKSLAYSIEKVNFSFNEVEYIGTEIGVPTNKVDETIEAILESYQELLIKGITKKEIKDKIKTLYFTAKRDNERAADWVDKFDGCLYQEENPVVGDFPDIYNFRETITEKEIKEVLQKYIKLDKFHLFIFGKKSSKKHF